MARSSGSVPASSIWVCSVAEHASGDGAGPNGQRSGGDGLTGTLPGLARLYAAAWWHTAEWTLSSSLHAASRLARSAARGETPAELAGVAAGELRDYARQVWEIVDPDRDSGAGPGETARAAPG
jgi:hypothetical protein